MEFIFSIFLVIHIAGGFLGLIAGSINTMRKKGDKNHKLIGKIFFFSMIGAGISSLVLAAINPNFFLFVVGIFTIYLVGSGQLYLKNRKSKTSNTALKKMEWVIRILMLLAGILLIVIGTSSIVQLNFFGLVYLTFGSFGLLFVRQDFINDRGKSRIKNYWLVAHLQRMTGGFISSLTAFLVVNAKYFPEEIPSFLYWLLPTIILTPLIIKWSRKYEVKKV